MPLCHVSFCVLAYHTPGCVLLKRPRYTPKADTWCAQKNRLNIKGQGKDKHMLAVKVCAYGGSYMDTVVSHTVS